MQKTRVAFFVDVLEEHFDGVSNTMHQIIRRIPRERIDPIFITPQPPLTDIGFPVYQSPYLKMLVNKGYRFGLPGLKKDLELILRSFQPHVIHWSSPSKMGSYAVKYALSNRLPLTTIYHTHFPSYFDYFGGQLPLMKYLTQHLLDRMLKKYQVTDRVFAPTQSMSDYLKAHGVESARVKIWGRGVDRTLFKPEAYNPEFLSERLAPDERKILFVSRLVKEKETETLIRLHDLLKETHPGWRMVITGEGRDRNRMERKMPEAIFTGKLQGAKLAEAYASSDIFIFPSVTETFGNVVLEAMACGLPVVAANAGGPADIVQEGETGLLVEPKKEHEFLAAIERIFSDQALYQAMKSNAEAYADRQSWRVLCEELFGTYEQLAISSDH